MDLSKIAEQGQREEDVYQRAEKGLRAYALAADDLALIRAVREGYEVGEAALDLLLDWIARAVCDQGGMNLRLLLVREGTPLFGRLSWEERAAPKAYAFDVYDRVLQAVHDVPAPDGVDVFVSRVVRVLEKGEDDGCQGEKYTGVVVTFDAPGYDRRFLVVRAE